jgi:hypothetical protein
LFANITTNISAAGYAGYFLYPCASIGGSTVGIIVVVVVVVVVGKSSSNDEGLQLTYKHQSPGTTATYVSLGIICREAMRLDGTRKVQCLQDAIINGTTASTSTTTGALVVSGGTDIAGAVNAGGAIKTTDTTASTSTTTGSIIAGGGLGVVGAIYTGGNVNTPSVVCSSTSYLGTSSLESVEITVRNKIGYPQITLKSHDGSNMATMIISVHYGDSYSSIEPSVGYPLYLGVIHPLPILSQFES